MAYMLYENTSFIDLDHLKLSAQVALLGNVSNNLRAMNVSSQENIIEIALYYDGDISDDIYELGAQVIDQIIADFSRDDLGRVIEFNTSILLWDFPKTLPNEGYRIYLRYENDYATIQA